MAGSSLKKATKSAHTHRERRQPESRQKLGLLEKKKDYRARADDYNKKTRVLKKLRQKALNKNPDEFNHHMINSKLEDGQHFEKSKEATLTADQTKLLQTRDLRYIVSKRTAEQKKIERMKPSLQLLESGAPRNKHTFFVDSEKEKRLFDLAARLCTHPELLGRTYNRPKMEALKSADLASSASPEVVAQREKSYRELQQRIKREGDLALMQAKMETRKHLQNKRLKPAKMVKEETAKSAAVLKWPQERKR